MMGPGAIESRSGETPSLSGLEEFSRHGRESDGVDINMGAVNTRGFVELIANMFIHGADVPTNS